MITSLKIENLPYRPCVGAMIFNAQGMVFVGRRRDASPDDTTWQMPQGGIDDGEKPRKAVKRECREEIGTDKFRILAESADWHVYDLPTALIGKTWGGRYRGQKQKWFALRFTGSDNDIDLQAAHPMEFSAWKWVEVAEVPGLVVPFKRAIYRNIVSEFGHWSREISKGH